ncbi:MAG: hypothetical protein LQ352_001778 [Teloschistes flavicans]|nr:MAG: hypothetical protein LQ352_001778 [Teloschistes flavicans]
MAESGSADDTSSPPPSAPRRQRAPTITIDTSAVSPPLLENDSYPLQDVSDQTLAIQGDQDAHTGPPHAHPPHQHSSHSDLRVTPSFESRDSRPTSPHNISSPTSKWTSQPHNFLSVPSTRSRGNSVDTDDSSHTHSLYGGDTYVSSPSSSALGDTTRQTSTVHSNDNVISDPDALKADPGTEADFEVADNKFAFSPGQLSKLLNPKSFSAFHALGGLKGIEKGLRTDRFAGLSIDERGLDGSVTFNVAVAAACSSESKVPPGRTLTRSSTTATGVRRTEEYFVDRRRIFKDNRLPEKKAKSIFELAWLAYNDKVLILLTVAAVVSLALGIYQSVAKIDGESVQWVEGVAIMVAIIIVVIVGAANDWQKERQFVKLNKKKDDRDVKIIRSGKSREISVHDILVGDVMHLEPGDMIPVDGIFISGHNVKCDESSATGESDLLRKNPGDEVYAAIEAHQSISKLDPFIISGAKVTEGIGTFLVTAVGVNSSYGKTMMSLREDAQTTPLQSKLNVLAEYIAKLGLGAGLILFIATFIKFLVQLNHIQGGAAAKGQQFLNVFIVAVTIVVVAVPEGLPLAVTLALAFATTRMLKDNNLVRLLRACETMGNATTVCSDKTGTLTENKMSTVAGIIGTSNRFGDRKTPDSTESNSPQSPIKNTGTSPSDNGLPDQSAIKFVSVLHGDVQTLLKQSIAVNSTAFEGEMDGEEAFIGSKTETALLSFARDNLAMGPLNEERSNADIVQLVPFDSGRKCMATVTRQSNGRYRLFVKGASELMLGKCQRIVQDPMQSLAEAPITDEARQGLEEVINEYASRSLRTIGFLYKDYEQWPPKGATTQDDDPKLAVFDKIFRDMVFLGIVGIQDPLRVGVADAVRACQNAGVYVRMVTGDNLMTAKAIAEECNIFMPGGLVMEGPEFRELSKTQMDQTIPRLQVLARSSPDDKRMLVKRLKELGETVAVTGDGTNDAPALKTADVGFSMGIAGTEVAKEASAIILMDDNFASIVKAIMWGRAVNDSVKKFLQFQVTVNITAVILTFISAVANDNEESVLTAVQLLWVNLIMDTFAALALATDPPTPNILNRKPEPKSAPLITLNMWKMIVGQSIYQLAVTLVLYFAGSHFIPYAKSKPGVTNAASHDDQLQTLVFNTFVWMQIFNQYNNRRLDNKLNIFEGVQRNYFFIGIQFIIVAGQIMIVFVGGTAFSTTRQIGSQWAYSLILGLISIPVAMLLRLVPDEYMGRMIPHWFSQKATPELRISDTEHQYEWNPALVEIKEELSFLKKLRGGRLNLLVYKLQHPRETLLPRSRSASRTSSIPPTPGGEREGSSEYGGGGAAPPTPESRRSTSRRFGRSRSNSAFGPAAAMAGIVAGSVAGWSPIGRRDDETSTAFSESRGRAELESREGVEIHPGTRAEDPVVAHNPAQHKDPPSQVPELTPELGQNLAPPER